MLAVDKQWRKRKIGSTLVRLVVDAMDKQKADVV
jgi:predicted N-acetyltransferase YhbS